MINEEIANIVYEYIKRGIGCDYDIFNSPPPPIPIRPVKVKTLKERLEDNEMKKATSVQNIKNVRNISFSIEGHPFEIESKLTIVASTNDDVFAFEFEGSDLLEICKAAGLFTGWEKDQKIMELEKKNKQNKEIADTWSTAYYNLSKKFDELKDKKDKKIRELEKDLQEIQEAFPNLPETPITDAMLVDDNLRLTEENEMLKKENKKLEKELESIRGYLIAEIKRLRKKCDAENKLQEESSDQPSADNVNHPSHYTGRYECIDVMQDVFGDEATDNFCLCNAFKYIWRARKKNGLEDVKKAVWYLNKYIEEAEKDGVSKGEQI